MERPSAAQLEEYRRFLETLLVFTDEEWDLFSRHFYLRKLLRKHYFIEAGEVCNEVAFILQGSTRFVHVKEGEEITGYFSLEGEMLTSYKSFLTRLPSTPFIEALEPTVLIVFSYDSLQLLLKDPRVNYKMERFGRLVAESVICCFEDRVFAFVTQTPEERYLALLKSSPNIIRRIPQHYIANYLGITPVSLSRIRRRILEPAGGIKG